MNKPLGRVVTNIPRGRSLVNLPALKKKIVELNFDPQRREHYLNIILEIADAVVDEAIHEAVGIDYKSAHFTSPSAMMKAPNPIIMNVGGQVMEFNKCQE